jgi:hypothetical protein
MTQPLTWRFFILPIAVVIIFLALYWPARAVVIGGRPKGCPTRFCGCALSLKLFGKIVPELNLAASWLRFPPTPPAPGMVAARRGHVFQLIRHVGGRVWVAYDANSGGGKIRVHARSIAGYRIVSPLSRTAMAGEREW